MRRGSVYKALMANESYERHKERLEKLETIRETPRDHLIKLQKKNQQKHFATKTERKAQNVQTEKDNLRLLESFLEI